MFHWERRGISKPHMVPTDIQRLEDVRLLQTQCRLMVTCKMTETEWKYCQV